MATTTNRDPLPQAALETVETQHQFVAQWFRADGEATAGDLQRFQQAFADDFVLVGPNGWLATRDDFLGRMEAARGIFADSSPPLQIRVEKANAREIGEDLCIVTYELWREQSGKTDMRAITTILRREPQRPGGFAWLHVHETWHADYPGKLVDRF